MVLFNFRADRMVEMSKALEYEEFKNFDRKRWPKVGVSLCSEGWTQATPSCRGEQIDAASLGHIRKSRI